MGCSRIWLYFLFFLSIYFILETTFFNARGLFLLGFDEGFKVLRLWSMIRLTLWLCNLVVCSDDSFNARGMEHVYLLANTFLDLIQRDKILPNSEFSIFIFFTNRIILYFYNNFLFCFWTFLVVKYKKKNTNECVFIFLFLHNIAYIRH